MNLFRPYDLSSSASHISDNNSSSISMIANANGPDSPTTISGN